MCRTEKLLQLSKGKHNVCVNSPGERLCQEDLSWGLEIVLLHGGSRTNVSWRRSFNCDI